MPYFKDFNLLFIHIPKTGGSNIENFFFNYLKQKPSISNLLSNNINLRINNHSLQHMTYLEMYYYQNFFNIDFNNKIKIITVVRNPYDRILSEYYCKWGGIGRKKIHNSIDDFNNYLINNINKRDIHGDHYTEQYLYHQNINTNLHIIKYENLYNELNDLFKKYNLKIILEDKKVNTSRKRKFTTSDFNNELITLINNVYDKDFTLFNYKKNLI